MKLTGRALMLVTLILAIHFQAIAQLYVCGSFNNWDCVNPAAATLGPDGVYSIELDLTRGESFKMSTSKGGDWIAFDAGTLYPTAQIVAGTWIGIKHLPSSANIQAPQRALYTLSVDLNSMKMKLAGPGGPMGSWSGTLPVLFINTDGGVGVTSRDEYVAAQWWLDPMGCEGIEPLGSPEAPLATQIKGRGNYTWIGFEKKPYRLKLDKKQPMMGMPSSKHFVLLAHADDQYGFMRNEAGFEASRLMEMPWTPGSRPLEVVLDGDYIGLYFLTENIRVAKDRVNIVEQADEATAEVDGGWIVEIDNYDTDPHVTVVEKPDPYLIWFTYKSPEILSPQQSAYLRGQMEAVNNAVAASDKSDASELEALVDLDILARFYVVQELSDNCESFHGSCYLNRDRGEGCKWRFGPVWDFGNSFRRGDSRQFVWQDPAFHQVWIGQIYQFPKFQAAVKRVWADFLNNGPQTLSQFIATQSQNLAAAAAADHRRWPSYGQADEIAAAKAYAAMLDSRIAWLKTKWGAEPSSLDAITADAPAYRLATEPGTMIFFASEAAVVTIADVSGRTFKLNIAPGTNRFSFAPGIYIVEGRKVRL